MEVYHRGHQEHKWLQMATWNDLNKGIRQKNKYANLQYVNLHSEILIYAKSEVIFVANLRTFLAYLLQA